MNRILIVKDSTQIKEIQWNKSTKQMMIKFKNGQMYLYFEISDKIFGALCSADSVGTHFARFIRDQFKFDKVSSE